MNKNKHIWTNNEIEIVYKTIIQEYVLNEQKEQKDINSILDILCENNELRTIPRGSIKNRVQNLKSLLMEWEVPNSLNISPLAHVVFKDRKILKQLLDNYDVPYVYRNI